MNTKISIIGILTLGLLGCDFVYKNPLENDSDSDSGTEIDTGSTPPKSEFHKPLYMQEDPASPAGVDYEYNGVDVLLVVDNSGSMAEEQQLMATAAYTLINALNNPLPGWPYPPVPSVRVGVTSSDMGLVYGPTNVVPQDMIGGCGGVGDGADLIGPEGSLSALHIWDRTIECDPNDSVGCPDGWACVDADPPKVGVCEAPGGATEVDCAPFEGSDPFVNSAEDPHNFGTHAACLANIGTDGCGDEQPLKAAAQGAAVDRDDFIREDALLAVFVMSDEDDCSIESADLFETEEFSNPSLGKYLVACELYPEHLTSVATIKEELINAKAGDEHAVLFGALAGVPQSDICEGAGHLIETCLDHQSMQFQEDFNTVTGETTVRNVCERYDGDNLVTKAAPGRRIVSLVQEFQEYGYAYSICNDDYIPVMEDFSKQILRAMQPYEALEPL